MRHVATQSAFALSLLAICFQNGLLADRPEPRRQIFLHDGESSWLLNLVKGELYFSQLESRVRRPDDKLIPNPAPDWSRGWVRPEYTAEGVKLKLEAFHDHPGGYLVGDYSTDPPSVRLADSAGKNSSWKLHAKDRVVGGIENVNESGENGWLALASHGIVHEVRNAADMGLVTEHRRPVLSHKQRYEFTVEKQATGK